MDLFDNKIETPVIDPDKDYFPEIVGEGKKYADQRALARAAVEKDLFIKRVLEEKRQLEEDLKTRTNMQDFLDQMKTATKAPVVEAPVTIQADPNAARTVEAPDIEKLISSKLEEREAANARNRNLLDVKTKLTDVYGDDYPARVKQRAQELGIPIEWLNDAAAKSPKAFYELIGLGRTATEQPSRQIESSVNTTNFGQGKNVKNWAFYNKMRQENPVQYHSKPVQAEIWAQAKALGPDFY